MNNSHNRKRAFADVVTIEAWHDDFVVKKSRADLHADVVFGTARLGGETDSPVRFRLSIKRAEIVVIIPDSEPVSVDPKSVSRDSPEIEGRLTETFEEKSKVGSLAEGEATVSPVTASGRLKVQLEAGVSQSASKKLSFSGAARLMIVTQSQTDDDQYRWTVESRSQRPLAGRPWDAAKEPRLTLIDRRKDKSKSIPPTVRVEVRCKREDIVIEDLEVKDETLWASVKARAGFHNRMAAAESYIRDRLTEEGLEVKNISDIFGELTLASTTAESAGS